MDHSDGKIADLESGTALKTGETGEICVKSSLLMTGYYNRPDLTAQAIDRDGWLHTGDLGFLDSGGYLHYVGRIKELINRGGEKIIPAEVEAALSHYPGVKECKVIGLPDPYYGEEVCACLVPARRGEPPDAEQIRAYLEPRLASFKLPRHIVTLPALPMNPSGKVRRGELRRLAAEALGLKSDKLYWVKIIAVKPAH